MFSKVLILAVALCYCSATFAEEYTTYEGYKVYDIKAKDPSQFEILKQLAENESYDFFTLPRILGLPIRVMVAPEEQRDFASALESAQIKSTIINENFGETVKQEREQNNFHRYLRASSAGSISFNAYHRFAEINAYLDQLRASYPKRVTLKTIGKSYEGRALRTITITNGDGRKNKKVILVEAGMHAREWIAPAQALYVIQQLVEKFSENSYLLKDYDWVVLPLTNPDGYEYAHTNSRMWRKTRKPVTSYCTGTDGNRNFDFHWGGTGSSNKSCNEEFKGVKAFSEPETQALRDLMHSLTGRAKFYLALHSYGTYLIYPWGYTPDLPTNCKEIDAVAQVGAAAIRSATGTKYTVGSSTNVVAAAAGCSDDYALGKAKIPISITMELPDGGNYFDPSPKKIYKLVTESWIGIKAMAEKVMKTY